MSGRVAFVCAMPMALAPLARRLALRREPVRSLDARTGVVAGRPVVAVVTGMGTELATRGVESLLGTVEVERVVVVGITGGIDDAIGLGTLVRPEVVVDGATGTEYRPEHLGPGRPAGVLWTSDDLLTDPSVLADLRHRGVVALDMETAAIAAVSERQGVPWSVFRAVSDRATDGSVDQEVFAMSRQDGTPDLKAVGTYLVRHPGRVPALAGMARAARTATRRAADAAADAVAALGT